MRKNFVPRTFSSNVSPPVEKPLATRGERQNFEHARKFPLLSRRWLKLQTIRRQGLLSGCDIPNNKNINKRQGKPIVLVAN